MRLFLGCLLFLTTAGLTPTDEKGTSMYSLPMREQLLAILHRWSPWHWGLILLSIAVVVTLLGFARLTTVLRDAGEHVFSSSGLLARVMASAFFLIDLTFRRSIEYWAAQETARTGVMPNVSMPLPPHPYALRAAHRSYCFWSRVRWVKHWRGVACDRLQPQLAAPATQFGQH